MYLGNPLRKQAVFISVRCLLAWVGLSALVYWSHQSRPNGCGVSPFRTSRRALRAAKVRRRIANCVGPCCALIALVTKKDFKISTPSTTNLYLGNPLRKQAVFISIRCLLAWVGLSALVYWSHQSRPNGCGVSPFRTSRRALRAAKVRRRIANCVGPCCALIAMVTKREFKKKSGC